MAAFVRLAEPIPFESPDGQPVKLLILPADSGPCHAAAPGNSVGNRRNVFRRSDPHGAGRPIPDPQSVHARIIALAAEPAERSADSLTA